MRGQIPTNTSPSTEPYVAFRLLKIRFLDIMLSLDLVGQMEKGQAKADEPAMERFRLQYLVS
jgi:hypothetical protein